MARPSKYSLEFKQRAVNLLLETRGEHPSEWAALQSVASKLGVGSPETLRGWVRRAEIDSGFRPGVTSEDAAEVKRLKRENAELRRANDILKAASAFFAAELDRPLR